jgi:hypothetical protein
MGKYGRCRAKGGVSKSVGKCVGCGKEETDSGGSVVTRGSWWHDKCAGVKVADYEGAALWTCPNCLKVRQARQAKQAGQAGQACQRQGGRLGGWRVRTWGLTRGR